ncbi:universal stress protein [Streptomyces sp. NPDC058867]|uniref:universal stress protein n=1 Tax=unclassified Streptomyces TaxID=2593676 RepID=UPI0036751443
MERMIITGVDGSARSRTAADWAAREALSRGIPLRVVHAAPHAVERWPYRPEAVVDHAVAELVRRHPDLMVHGRVLTGAPKAELRAAGARAELLVTGLRGAGTHTGTPVGTTAAALVTDSAGPVVLVPGTLASPGPQRRPAGVVLGVDARDPAGGALDLAFATAQRHGTRLRAVHTWRLPASRPCLPWPVLEADRAAWEDHEVGLLSDALRPWREKYPEVEVVEDVRLLPTAEALAHASAHAELVVVGRRSGGTALALLRHAECPVAVVPTVP